MENFYTFIQKEISTHYFGRSEEGLPWLEIGMLVFEKTNLKNKIKISLINVYFSNLLLYIMHLHNLSMPEKNLNVFPVVG